MWLKAQAWQTMFSNDDLQASAVIESLINGVVATKEDKALLERCVAELARVVLEVFGNWNLSPFGSSANGFSTRFSDLDISCYPESSTEEEAKKSIQIAQNTFLPVLRQSIVFEVVEEIWTARVPIVKLRFANCLDVDLSFCNTEPFANTQLLKAYSKLDSKARLLVLLVKLWAKGENLCGAKDGHLSSYSYSLMTLYFLQVDEYIQMPCLPMTVVNGNQG